MDLQSLKLHELEELMCETMEKIKSAWAETDRQRMIIAELETRRLDLEDLLEKVRNDE